MLGTKDRGFAALCNLSLEALVPRHLEEDRWVNRGPPAFLIGIADRVPDEGQIERRFEASVEVTLGASASSAAAFGTQGVAFRARKPN